ncbi:MAG: family 43 glycosylhydrolase [Clostridia bacterium]|nr:family 43 glycosylhydrolase [Clostridia bacterium]
MNPILDDKYYVPDVEARPMPDGRLYLYGSWDVQGADCYCGKIHHCFSTEDMVNYVDHGIIFRNDASFYGVPWNHESDLYAPDAIEKDGKYYLYICGNHLEEGVAVADTPTGPFTVASRIDIADGDSIDPTVLVDDDGTAYLFWGQFHLRGGRLLDDMKTLDKDSINTNILNEQEHGFHEGASIRKRNGKYYMVYTDISRGSATCLSYAMADSPLGPYKKCGVIIDNVYCDPKSWNNHGSITEYKGQWYVFYHRSTNNNGISRRVCVEKISFDENGLIAEVEQTSQGPEGPIDARRVIPARCACRLMRSAYIITDQGREVVLSTGESHWGVPDFAEYKYIDFGNGVEELTLRVKGKGKISANIEGSVEIAAAEFDFKDYTAVTVKAKSITGVHPLWLNFTGEFSIMEFSFK